MKKINRYRKEVIFLFAVVAMICYLSISFIPSSPKQELVVNQNTGSTMLVYMIDQDDTLIPFHISIKDSLSTTDKLKKMAQYMSQDHQDKTFLKLFKKPVILEDVVIQDGVATLSFNGAFQSYEAKHELRVLESLVWGATQFQEIQQVVLAIDGKALTQMPVAHTPIPKVLNRSLGINNFETTTSKLFESQPVTIFYTKKIKDQTYYVPKTNRIHSSAVSLNDKVKAILDDISVTSKLQQPLYANQVKMSKDAYMEDQTLVVNLNQNILSEDRAAKKTAYETLVLSLAQIVGVEKIKVCVDDVVVSLHGSNEASISVSSLLYNQIAV